MEKIIVEGVVVDTCGTGGDDSGTFNISTAAALVVAGAGVKVAKHGNRSASSKCGSADVLEELGINIQMRSKQAEACLEQAGITFLYAPLYHPAMKHVAPVRKELGIRTVFNFLGPFVNPFGVRRQVIGVPNKNLAEKLAKVAKNLDYEHLMIVTSDDGLDEISISAKTYIYEIKKKTMKQRVLYPQTLGITKADKNDFIGGSATENAEIIEGILGGKKGARRDIAVVNAAAAFMVTGKVKTINEGIQLALDSIDSGNARETLAMFRKESKN